MAKWNFDMISRAEADRQTQEAVAAVLMEAADLVDMLSEDMVADALACAESHPAFADDRQEYAEDVRKLAVRIRARAPDGVRTDTDMVSRAEADRQTQAAVDRIEELEAKLAKVISAYRMEALRRRDYTHDAFDRHIAGLTGETT